MSLRTKSAIGLRYCEPKMNQQDFQHHFQTAETETRDVDVPTGGGIGDTVYTADLLNTEDLSRSELLSEPSHCSTHTGSPVNTDTHTFNDGTERSRTHNPRLQFCKLELLVKCLL